MLLVVWDVPPAIGVFHFHLQGATEFSQLSLQNEMCAPDIVGENMQTVILL